MRDVRVSPLHLRFLIQVTVLILSQGAQYFSLSPPQPHLTDTILSSKQYHQYKLLLSFIRGAQRATLIVLINMEQMQQSGWGNISSVIGSRIYEGSNTQLSLPRAVG